MRLACRIGSAGETPAGRTAETAVLRLLKLRGEAEEIVELELDDLRARVRLAGL